MHEAIDSFILMQLARVKKDYKVLYLGNYPNLIAQQRYNYIKVGLMTINPDLDTNWKMNMANLTAQWDVYTKSVDDAVELKSLL